jgi:hypothetical protein
VPRKSRTSSALFTWTSSSACRSFSAWILASSSLLARAHRVLARYVTHRDLADADSGIGLHAQSARIEIRRQADQLDASLARRDLRGALDRRAAGIEHDPGNSPAVLRWRTQA